jgi:hypothetical protein
MTDVELVAVTVVVVVTTMAGAVTVTVCNTRLGTVTMVKSREVTV